MPNASIIGNATTFGLGGLHSNYRNTFHLKDIKDKLHLVIPAIRHTHLFAHFE